MPLSGHGLCCLRGLHGWEQLGWECAFSTEFNVNVFWGCSTENQSKRKHVSPASSSSDSRLLEFYCLTSQFLKPLCLIENCHNVIPNRQVSYFYLWCGHPNVAFWFYLSTLNPDFPRSLFIEITFVSYVTVHMQ